MTTVWIVVAVVGLFSIVFKSAGPVFLGGRELPPRAASVVALIGPVMLTALVVTQTVGRGEHVVLDLRLPGVAAAAIAVRRGAPVVVGMAVAAAVTATLRALS
jgi:branched-subunit amino acid transport protein